MRPYRECSTLLSLVTIALFIGMVAIWAHLLGTVARPQHRALDVAQQITAWSEVIGALTRA